MAFTVVGEIAIYENNDPKHREHVHAHQTDSFDDNKGVPMRLVRNMYRYLIVRANGGFALIKEGGKRIGFTGAHDSVEQLLAAFQRRIYRNKIDSVFVISSPEAVSYLWTDLN